MEEISVKELYMKKVGINNIPQSLNTILTDNKISKGIIISKKSYNINLVYQSGGHISYAELNGATYEYNVSKIKLIDNYQKSINFMTIDDKYDYCATLIYDNPEFGSNMILEGLFNGDDCIKCLTSGIEYKVGDILMQIILKITKENPKFSHIKTITLRDNSIMSNGDNSVELIYLRTITHGIPFYAKYGFRPKIELIEKNEEKENKDAKNILNDYDIFKFNRNLFNKKPILTKEQVDKLIKNKLTSDEEEMFIKDFSYKINKFKKIKASELLNLIVEKYKLYKKTLKNNDENNQEDNLNLKNENKLINKNLQIVFNIILKIYKKIYKLCGYKEYVNKIWILQITH